MVKKFLKGLLGTIAFFLLIFTMIVILLYTSCNSKTKKSSEKSEVSISIISNAKRYINNKYNIEADVMDSMANYEWEGFDFVIPHKKYTGSYSLTMQADGQQFNVLIGNNGIIRDDYQHAEITESLQKFFADMLPSPDIRVNFKGSMYTDYIDCSNMEKFLDEYYSIVDVYLIDSDLNSVNFDEVKEFARNCESSICLMSCRSADARDSLIDGRRTRKSDNVSSTETGLGSDYALFVNEIWQCIYNSKDDIHTEEYAELKLGNYGDLYYTIPENSDVTVTESSAKYYVEDKYNKFKLITPAFKLKCSENFTVFYPVSKAEDVELELNEVYKCCGNQVDIIGDYFVYRIHTEKWYRDNNYYGNGDKKYFGVYVDHYY